MTSKIIVRHNFESGHRLPQLPAGKCHSLHGHSWWAEITATCPQDTDVVVEFGDFKRHVRQFIDDQLDHGVMLGAQDPLASILPQFGKVYLFGGTDLSSDLEWPTVENVARLLARTAQSILDKIDHHPGTRVTHVDVRETHVNSAGWTA